MRRTGGFASPPYSGFAFIVCDNMHNVGFHYKVLNPKRDLRRRTRGESANYVTFLCPQKS
jgi:hypothetical protein